MESILKRIPKIIILTMLFIFILGTIVNAREIFGIIKTDAEWLALKNPTLIEETSDGSWKIVWAVDDPPKTNAIHYETSGYRIHTAPTSGSGNPINNIDRNKLINNRNNYGVETKMDKCVTIYASTGSQLSMSDKQRINGNDYWFRLLVLTSDNLKTLFGSEGYQTGDKLYFSGIMNNYLGNGSPKKGLKTYKAWSADGMHNIVFSQATRGEAFSAGGNPTKTDITNANIVYIGAVQNHYDRVITINKVQKHNNVKVEIYLKDDDGAYILDDTKTMSQGDIIEGTKIKVNGDDNNVQLFIKNEKRLGVVSPIQDGYEYDASQTEVSGPKEGTGSYTLGNEVTMAENDIVFKLYYKKEADDNEVFVIYKVKDGEIFEDRTSLGKKEKGSQQVYEGIPETKKVGIIDYKFYDIKTCYGSNPLEYNSSTVYKSSYNYRVSASDDNTYIIIQYIQPNTTPPEEEHKSEEYTDESLDADAKGHILSDGENSDYPESYEYNTMDGIPSSEHIYTFVEANGYIYKIKGRKYTGKKNYTVKLYRQDPPDIFDLKLYPGYYTVKETGPSIVVQKSYEYFTIEQYNIIGLSNLIVKNELLRESGINYWDTKGIGIIANQYYPHDFVENVEGFYIPNYRAHTKVGNADEGEVNAELSLYDLKNKEKALREAEEKALSEARAEAEAADLEEAEEKALITLKVANAKADVNAGNYPRVEIPVDDDTICLYNDYNAVNLNLADKDKKERAQVFLDTDITQFSDYIEITKAEGTDGDGNGTRSSSSKIDPANDNRALLKYDPTEAYIIDFDALIVDFEEGESLSRWGRFIKRMGEIADKFEYEYDDLKAQLEGQSGLKNRTRIFISWLRSKKGEGEGDGGVDDYNTEAKRVNEIPREVMEFAYCKDDQLIAAEQLNNEYQTTLSIVNYNYYGDTFHSADIDEVGIEEEYQTQPIKGAMIIPDQLSYVINKTFTLSGVLNGDLADKLLYITDKVNNVFVHTPVSIEATIEGVHPTQYVGSITSADANILQIGDTYTIKLDYTSMHRHILGFKERDYDRFIKKLEIQFPYDIYITVNGKTIFCKEDEWATISTTHPMPTEIKILIPDWAELEEGIVNYNIRVNALNEADGDPSQLGWERVNMNTIIPTKYYTDMPKDYRAYCSIATYAVGKLYDFRVNFTQDPEYILTYTSGKLKEGTTGYDADGLRIGRLPLGKAGTNASNMDYGKALKLGNKFKFNLKTLGWKTNIIGITPTFYYIDKATGDAQAVNLYYIDTATGKYVNDISKYIIYTTMPTTQTAIPNTSPIRYVAEPGPSSGRMNTTNQVKDAYTKGILTEYTPKYLGKIASATKYTIGSLKGVTLSEYQRIRLQESTNVKENAANSIWYGEYELPSNSVFVKSGNSFGTENILTKAKDGDGYILVCFNIMGYYHDGVNDPYDYLNYQRPNGGGTTQWAKEGFSSAISLPNGKSGSAGNSTTYVGVALYEAFENNNGEIINPH